ncbi:MAG: methyltransferase domain-containing protein [Candidatus Magasanikbacteria bacterium]
MIIFLEVIAGMLILWFIVILISSLIGVPYLPTHKKQARLMIELANLKPGMKVVDLGSGTGRLLFLAAQKGAQAVGYEINPLLFWWTRIKIFIFRKNREVTVKFKSLYYADLKDVDVVFCFLFPNYMIKLEDKLFSELKPGAKIISYVFSITTRVPIIKKEGISVYVVGE